MYCPLTNFVFIRIDQKIKMDITADHSLTKDYIGKKAKKIKKKNMCPKTVGNQTVIDYSLDDPLKLFFVDWKIKMTATN